MPVRHLLAYIGRSLSLSHSNVSLQLKKSGSSSSFFRRRKSSDETLRVPEDAKEGSTSGKHKFRKLISEWFSVSGFQRLFR